MIQNYPNPFNPSTVISYRLSNDSHVMLKIFDALGREIATLLNEKKSKGDHEFHLDAGNYNLSSGIYFVEMTAGTNVSTIKLVLAK
jgi:flagellar hook assembly protein FlgD